MGSLNIVNGKFQKDGVFVPVEFGNKEQLIAIEVADKRNTSFKNGLHLSYNTEVNIQYSAYFRCTCGSNIYMNGEDDTEDDPSCLLGIEKCYSCNQSYEVYKNGFKLMVRLA
jgi:hypothetical protein